MPPCTEFIHWQNAFCVFTSLSSLPLAFWLLFWTQQGMPEKMFFYCRTCLEHIVSEQDLKDPFNQTQITVHGRVSSPSLQGTHDCTTPTHLSESTNLSFVWKSRCDDEILGHKSCCTPPCPTVLWTELKLCNYIARLMLPIGLVFYQMHFTNHINKRWIKMKNGKTTVKRSADGLQPLMKVQFVLVDYLWEFCGCQEVNNQMDCNYCNENKDWLLFFIYAWYLYK